MGVSGKTRIEVCMFETAALVVIGLIIVGLGLVIWRTIRGPVRRSGAVRRAVLLALITAPTVFVASWQVSKSRTFQIFGEMVTRVDASAPLVALTFDDGPTPQFTDTILAILRDRNVKATFFVTGSDLEQNPSEAQRLVAEGHQLGNHTYSHEPLVYQSFAFIEAEIEKTDQLIRKAGYKGEILFRAPYGKRLILLPYYLASTGRKHIYYDVEPDSYPEIAASADSIVQYVLDNVQPGSIILLHVMHPNNSESMKAVPGILRGLQARGYRFVTVSELLAARESPRGAAQRFLTLRLTSTTMACRTTASHSSCLFPG
jgi:peptidoglycan/xylan/chitin deacetylase (PgdA/CDA1 family)